MLGSSSMCEDSAQLLACRAAAGVARHPLAHRGPRRLGCFAELRAAVAQAIQEPWRAAQYDDPGAPTDRVLAPLHMHVDVARAPSICRTRLASKMHAQHEVQH